MIQVENIKLFKLKKNTFLYIYKIYINELIEPGSFEDRQTINHEMRHATDIKIGKLSYEDDYITYNGEDFPRMDIDGVDSILVDGEWKEAGDTGFPWENDANNGDN